MAYQKLQTSRALFTSTASDSIIIPDPANNYLSSTRTAAGTSSTIVDTSVNFVTLGVKVGDIAMDGKGVRVDIIEVKPNLLTLSTGSFTAGTDPYKLYLPSNQGCILYVNELFAPNTSGDLAVITAGGDTVIYKNVTAGQFLPVQVTHWIKSGTADVVSVIANW